MRVQDTALINSVEDVYILQSGSFFFFNGYIIAEVKEGVTFTWETAQDVINLAYAHYGKDVEITYITNRVNSYSIVPQDWLKFFDARHSIRGLGIVTYSDMGIMNVALEKLFFRSRLKRFENLLDAVIWAEQIALIQKEKS